MTRRFFVFCLLIMFNLLAYASPALKQINENTILKQAPDLKQEVLSLGLKAYDHARLLGMDHQGIISIIDYSEPSTSKRLWVIDLNHNQVLFNALVAHGRESGNNYAHYFSDSFRSDASSIGVYLTGQTYYGKHGYSLRLHGLDKGYNDTAYQRAVVMHSAWYVSDDFLRKYGRLGRSWGCPALNPKVSSQVISTIKNGTILLAYYPDKSWLNSSQFV